MGLHILLATTVRLLLIRELLRFLSDICRFLSVLSAVLPELSADGLTSALDPRANQSDSFRYFFIRQMLILLNHQPLPHVQLSVRVSLLSVVWVDRDWPGISGTLSLEWISEHLQNRFDFIRNLFMRDAAMPQLCNFPNPLALRTLQKLALPSGHRKQIALFQSSSEEFPSHSLLRPLESLSAVSIGETRQVEHEGQMISRDASFRSTIAKFARDSGVLLVAACKSHTAKEEVRRAY